MSSKAKKGSVEAEFGVCRLLFGGVLKETLSFKPRHNQTEYGRTALWSFQIAAWMLSILSLGPSRNQIRIQF